MPPTELSMSTVALSDRMASACSLMLSIKPCCEDDLSGVFEYWSSTGRVREKTLQPVVDKTARNEIAAQKGERLRMKYLDSSTTLEYIVPERLQKLGRTVSEVYVEQRTP